MFTTVTTGQFGSLHPRPNREARRLVSRSHRASSPHQCLPVRFIQLIVGDDSFNRLKPRAISGEIATPSGTGACDMRSTGTGSDPVFAHVDSHSGPCAVLPPNGDGPHRTDRGHFTTSAETSPAPTASVRRETSNFPPLNHPHCGEFQYSPSRKLGVAQSTCITRFPCLEQKSPQTRDLRAQVTNVVKRPISHSTNQHRGTIRDVDELHTELAPRTNTKTLVFVHSAAGISTETFCPMRSPYTSGRPNHGQEGNARE